MSELPDEDEVPDICKMSVYYCSDKEFWRLAVVLWGSRRPAQSIFSNPCITRPTPYMVEVERMKAFEIQG